MKKIYFALAVVATAMLSSCVEEQSFNEMTLGENELSFVLNGVTTKSADFTPQSTDGVTIPMGDDGQGSALYLEETIEELNPSPVTKGAPAYTVNLGTLYTTMGVYATQGSFGGDATFEVMDEYEHKGTPKDPNAPNNNGWRYNHNYSGRPWPTSDTEVVDFYFNMPASPVGVTFNERANKVIKFTYDRSDLQALSTAVGQQDILFSQASYSKTQHDSYLENGAPVLMYHALTGVKFRSGSDNTGATKTIITKVEFSGLQDYGKCVVDPSAENVVVWTDQEVKLGSFSQEFKNQTWEATSGVDGTVNYGTYNPETSKFGESWYKAAGDKNLNDDDATQTFWFIPQVISEDVKLKVTFRVKTEDTQNGTEITHTINFGKLVKGVEWKAGQLRTYTLNPKDVDVEIFDTMSGKSKTNLHVTNTGNVPEYIRMLVIGNWYGWESEDDQEAGKEPEILVGYKTDGSGGEGDDEMADPWFREDPQFGQYFDSTFLNGKPAGTNKWVRGNTAFYYPDPIGPGVTLDSATEALFKSYIWPENEPFPTIYIPDPNSNIRKPAVGVHLIMEVAVQAIGALKPDGSSYSDHWEAWTNAIYPNGGGTIGPK